MANGVIWSTLYLGNFADMDTDEGTNSVEDASALLTTFGSGQGNALSNNIVDVTTNAGADTTLNSNNPIYEDEEEEDYFISSDRIVYDLGAGSTTAALDSTVLLAGTVTFHDGTTFSGNFGVMQDTTGNIFMTVLDSQPELASQGIKSITFSSVVESNYIGINQATKDDHDFVCFGPGTRIDTPFGPKRADKLALGDLVTTLDDGPQPIRWIGRRRLVFEADHPAKPVRIAKSAFAPGLPRRDMLLSPDHRLLLRTQPTHALHDPLGALAPAKALTRLPGIRRATGRRAITYFSFLLPAHCLLIAEGIATESLYPGAQSWARLTGPERSDWLRLATEARVTGVPPARLLLSTGETRAGLDLGAMALPDTAPRPQLWTAQRRRTRPLPAHALRA